MCTWQPPGSKNAIVLTSSGDQFDRIPLASIHQRYAILSSQAHRPHSPFSICPLSTHPSPYLGSVRLRQYSTANVSRPWPCSCRALLAVLIGSPRAASAHDSHSTLHSSQDTMNASLAAIHLVPIVANRGANALPTLRTAAQCRMLPNPCACHLHRSVGNRCRVTINEKSEAANVELRGKGRHDFPIIRLDKAGQSRHGAGDLCL